MTVVMDFVKIKTGWFYFGAGKAPEKVFDPSLTQRAPKPEGKIQYTDPVTKIVTEKDKFTRGFSLVLFSKALGLRELSATSLALSAPINALYGQYETAPESKQGMLPVVKIGKSKAETGKHGTNFIPSFAVEKWVARPPEFDTAPTPPASVASATDPVAVQDTGSSEF